MNKPEEQPDSHVSQLELGDDNIVELAKRIKVQVDVLNQLVKKELMECLQSVAHYSKSTLHISRTNEDFSPFILTVDTAKLTQKYPDETERTRALELMTEQFINNAKAQEILLVNDSYHGDKLSNFSTVRLHARCDPKLVAEYKKYAWKINDAIETTGAGRATN